MRKNMASKSLTIITFLLGVITLITIFSGSLLAQGSCTAQYNCTQCNSGGFTISCTCTSIPPNSICESCTPGGCTNPPCNKCCRNVTYIQGGTPVTQKICTGSKCAGSCTNEELYSGDVRPSSNPYWRRDTQTNSFLSVRPSSLTFSFLPQLVAFQIPIEVASFRGANLFISEIEPELDGASFKALRFKLKNLHSRGLIASGIVVDLYWASRAEPLRIVQSSDRWFLQSPGLSPNETEEVVIATSVNPDKKDKLTKIIVAIDYAEFDDGTWAGEDSAGFRSGFIADRQQQSTVQREFAARLKGGESIDRIVSEIEKGPDEARFSQKEVRSRRSVYSRLYSLYQVAGKKTLAEKLMEPARQFPTTKLN